MPEYSVTIVIVGPDNEETVGSTDIIAGGLDYQMVQMLDEWATKHGLEHSTPLSVMVQRLRREI